MKVGETVKKTWEISRQISDASTGQKNQALEEIASRLKQHEEKIIEANRVDLEELKKKEGYSKAFQDRLFLDGGRIEAMADGLKDIISLNDPVGEVTSMWKRPNGLQVGRVRVPLGVVAIIYEARPNVTIDAAGLGLKSGNSVILRGSSEALNSNRALVEVIQESLEAVGLPRYGVALVEQADREAARDLMRQDRYLDVIIPRGGPALKKTVMENATVPVVETGEGNCHVYVDESAEVSMAVPVAVNSKVQRPGVCNALETLLVHESIADAFLPEALEALRREGVEIRGCTVTRKYHGEVKTAEEEDWSAEYLDLVLAVKVVKSLEEAVNHINTYGTGHSESIVTSSYRSSREFMQKVDAAAVYVNASTRFTDGNVFGLGAEMGISTQKLHARGPMGLESLTSTKFIIYGDGQIRE